MTEDILIVDDNPANIHLLAGLLSKRGFKIRKATSGQLALIAVAQKKPDLILLDARNAKCPRLCRS